MRLLAPARTIGLSLLLTLTVLFLFGCSDEQSRTVDRIKIISGNEQCALPGHDFKQELKIELLGPKVPGLLGGQGSRAPVADVPVHFVPVDGSDLTVTPATAVSDAGGAVTVKVAAGKQTGDQYLDIIPGGFEKKAIRLRFITGMELKGEGREYKASGISTEPVGVKLVGADGKPAADIPVRFQLLSTAEGTRTTAAVDSPVVLTDADGVAETRIKLGDKTGSYQIGIEIMAPDKGFLVSSKPVKIFGFNLVGVVVSVLGGLSLFVFGMKLMGDGIQTIAGENMKKLLQFFARNGIVAVLAGTLVTAVIQSSSATTVMVIGFINAGLLSLVQSIGIIFGANIGTTVTAQIISFNLSGLALPAITIGFLITLSSRRVISGWGETILGFGLLFFGMTMMSDELKVLGEFGSFREAFNYFDCSPVNGWMPFLAVLGAMGIGVVATVLIQSSSAAMGIVLALAGSGLINFYTAVPLLVGTNIGTTITAMLAAIAANRVAKQAALAHTLFNVFGALLMLLLFYVPYGPERIPVFLYFINEITPGNAFAAVPQNLLCGNSSKVTLRQLREADETLANNVKTATYEAFQIMRREYEMKLREEERRKRLEELRKERLAEDDETPAKDAKKLPADETPASKEREKKKNSFLAREKKKGGNRIKTAENSRKNYETIRGESEFPRFLRCIESEESGKRGTVESWNLPSDSENELASPSEIPRESSTAVLGACSPGSFYDEEGGRFGVWVEGRDGAAAGRDAAADGAGGAGAGGRGGDAVAGTDVVVELAAGGGGVETAQWERAVETEARSGRRRGGGVEWAEWALR